MRKSLLTSLVLGCGTLLGLVSFSASATPIHPGIQVNLAPASGSTLWTSPPIGDPHGTVTLSGWEYDKISNNNYAWTAATMNYKNLGYAAEQGLGVLCNQTPYHNECSQKEIGSTPWQMIDVNISALHGWNALSLSLGSVNGNQFPVGDETGYLLGASCQVGGSCTPITIASCTDFGGPGKPATCSFSFTKEYLLGLGITDIWVTPSLTNQSTKSNGNILLGGTLTLFVPEPATLGMFGLGVLLIGLFAGLRRRKTD